MKNRLINICALVFLLSAATLSSATEEFKFNNADGLILLVYDNSVEPAKNKLLSSFHDTEFIIDGEGYIQLGSFGKIYIAGKSIEETTAYLEDKFKPYGKNLMVLVTPLIRVVMKGEFGKTGMYRFSPNISFWDAVAEAGGMSNSLAAENMYLLRNGDIVYADFMSALYAGVSLKELGIQSGDELIAPRITRLSFNSIMRYVSFFSSLILLYLALTDKQRN
jgi:protein involved in polysaccharide export with SLBB domain